MLNYTSKSKLLTAPRKLTATNVKHGNFFKLSLKRFSAVLQAQKNQTELDLTELFLRQKSPDLSFYNVKPGQTLDFKIESFVDESCQVKLDELNIQHYTGEMEAHQIDLPDVKGSLLHPKNPKNTPAIMMVGGLTGMIGTTLSVNLVNQGYTVFNVNYPGVATFKFTDEIMTGHYDLNYFENCLQSLKNLKHVNAEKLLLLGISRGGEICCNLKLRGQPEITKSIQGIATLGSPIWDSCFYPQIYNGKEVLQGSCTVLKKFMLEKFDQHHPDRQNLVRDLNLFRAFYFQDVEFLKQNCYNLSDRYGRPDFENFRSNENENLWPDHAVYINPATSGLVLGDMHHLIPSTLQKLGMYEKSRLELEKIDCPIYAYFGGLDENVPAEYCRENFLKLRKSENEFKIYPESGHVLNPPFCISYSSAPEWPRDSGIRMAFGGNEMTTGLAWIDWWDDLTADLSKIFAE